MARHNTIVLEEPRDAQFSRMLNQEIGIDEYLQNLDIAYPIFSRGMCELMQQLAAQGKQILQAEPYLDTLVSIHEFFADGGSPAKLPANTLCQRVYALEKLTTAALLNFYEISVSKPFDAVVESVRQFARQDAARFRLRDELRAQVLVPLVEKNTGIFIESGLMHYGLRGLIQKQMSEPQRMQTVFLADNILRRHGLKGRLYGPGDCLTLLYIFHPQLSWPTFENLLAARALVYNRLCPQDELAVGGKMPHLKNELACIEQVSRLTFEECRRLYRKFRKTGHSDGAYILK